VIFFFHRRKSGLGSGIETPSEVVVMCVFLGGVGERMKDSSSKVSRAEIIVDLHSE